MKLSIAASVVFIFTGIILYGQSAATITDVDFSLENNLIKVNYSLTGALSNELFTISLSFSDESGGTIIPVSVSGDIGANIAPGFNKTILWDVDKDNIEITGVIKAIVKIRRETSGRTRICISLICCAKSGRIFCRKE